MDVLHNLQWVLPMRSPALTQLALALSWLGYTTFIMFFLALGYWTWSKAIFYRLLILVVINALLNAYVKDLFQDPRPPLSIRLDDLVGASYGLPSGHAQLAVVMWMWLAWELRRAWAWALGSAIALGVIVSRLYLGVHDLEDVLIGAALGAGSLLLFEQVRHQRWAWQTSLGWNAALITSITTLTLLSWPGTAPEYIPTLAGWLLAATGCLRIDNHVIRFTPPPTWWLRIGAGLLGVACFMAEQKLLKFIALNFPIDPMLWALAKGLVSGVFVSLLMPWMFQRLRLAIPQAPPQ